MWSTIMVVFPVFQAIWWGIWLVYPPGVWLFVP